MSILRFLRELGKSQGTAYGDDVGLWYTVKNGKSFLIVLLGGILLFTLFISFSLKDVKLFPSFYILYFIITSVVVVSAYKFKNKNTD